MASRSRFKPLFCPWPACTEHRRTTAGYQFRRNGTYATRLHRKVPRFRCGACGRHFSRQSFAASYYSKRPELIVPVAVGLVDGLGHRQLARSLECAPSTVSRLCARLGRRATLLQALGLDRTAGS